MSRDIAQFAGKALVPIAVLAAFALFRKYLPAPGSVPGNEAVLDDLNERFRRVQWIVGFVMLTIAGLVFLGTHIALLGLNHYIAVTDAPQAVFRLWPQRATWWFFPGFAGITLCWEIALRLWAAFGDAASAALYSTWSNQRAGFDATKVLRWMMLLIALPIGVLTILALPVHTTVGEHAIQDCGYAFAGCKTFAYSDARRMTLIKGFRDRDGKLHPRAAVILDFVDHRRWSSAVGDFKSSIDPALVSFLSDRTHLIPGQAETEADIPKN